jgi:hypothetical protein
MGPDAAELVWKMAGEGLECAADARLVVDEGNPARDGRFCGVEWRTTEQYN